MDSTGPNVHNMDTPSVAGAQAINRAANVLRAISTSMPDGAGTTEVARKAGVPRPTTHRLLSALTVEGFVDRDQRTGRWTLGPELYLMGTVAAERYDITHPAREHVDALAAATGESAFFSVRRGNETVCLLRTDGSFPIRSFVLYEGKRFPLGVATAGLAVLSFLPDAVIDEYLEDIHLEPEYGEAHSANALRQRIETTRRNGYALNPGLIVEGSWGMGAAVFAPSGQPAWAFSLTGIESRFTSQRQPELGGLLLDHAHQLTQQLAKQ